jgi:hypothetical protein
MELRLSCETNSLSNIKKKFLRFIDTKFLFLPSYAILSQTNPLHAHLSYL